MKLFKNTDKRTVLTGLAIAAGSILLYCLIGNFASVKAALGAFFGYFAPVTYGLLLAYVLRPFAKFFERALSRFVKSEKARVHISALSTLALLLVLIFVVMYLVVPQLISSITAFVGNLDSYIASGKNTIDSFLIRVGVSDVNLDKFIGTSDEILSAASGWVTENINYVLGALYTVGSRALNFIIILAMSVYALLDRKNIKKGLLKLETAVLGEEKSAGFNVIVNRGDSLMMKFLTSNLLDALIICVINLVFLSIVKAPYQILLSVFLGVINFIPTFGPIIGGIIAGFVVLLTKPSLLLIFIVFTVVLQQIDGNVIKPVLFGDSTGLSPFWVLVAIIVGGRMFGVLGMIVGIPLLALIASVYTEVLDGYLEKKKNKQE